MAPSNAAVSPTEVDQQVGTNRLISKSLDGSPADGAAFGGSVSADGRYVAFDSNATNLVEGVASPTGQIYVRDRRTGTTILASRSSGGEPGNGPSGGASISADGRYVAFVSEATNLAGGFDDGEEVFRIDLRTLTTTLVTHSRKDTVRHCYAPSISADGRFVAYYSQSADLVRHDKNSDMDVFLYDYETGKTVAVSNCIDGDTAEGYSADGHVSADGSTVLFDSNAKDIVAGHRGKRDVIAYDIATGVNRLVTKGNKASTAEGISGDGTHAVFRSMATNLGPGLPPHEPQYHAYLADLATGDLLLVDHGADGDPGNGEIWGAAVSDDGSLVTYASAATDLVPDDQEVGPDVFLFDVANDTTMLVSQRYSGEGSANGTNYVPHIAGDGSFVTYYSGATDLVRGDADASPSVVGYRVS